MVNGIGMGWNGAGIELYVFTMMGWDELASRGRCSSCRWGIDSGEDQVAYSACRSTGCVKTER